MAGKYKSHLLNIPIDSAISDFYSELEELAGECREVVDGAEGGRAETQRIQTLGDTADTLEQVSTPDEPDYPKEVAEIKVEFYHQVPRSKRQQCSRAVRRDNASAGASAAINELREWCDTQEEALDEGRKNDEGNPEDASEGAIALVTRMREEREALIQEIRDYCDEVEAHISEAEGAEFPGMMG